MSAAPDPPLVDHTATSDARLTALRGWLASLSPDLALDAATLAPASTDASFRRYFRLDGASATVIAMDAPPDREDSAPFVRIAALMAAAGLVVPRVLAQDLVQGFLLLTDLGRTTYLSVLDPETPTDAAPLMMDAVDALIRWQVASLPGVLPEYDEALLRRELALFPDWYVSRHLGITLDDAQRAVLDHAFDRIVSANLDQPRVYVHRDYMPRNLMVGAAGANPGVLDFQDAVHGPISYDVASLFKDAFLSWDEEVVLDWTVRYWERAKKAGLPVRDDFGDFYRDVEWMGLQRHLKVLGIFARICHRDGKPRYLADTPRFVRYVRATADRYRALGPLLKLIDQIEGTIVSYGYTF